MHEQDDPDTREREERRDARWNDDRDADADTNEELGRRAGTDDHALTELRRREAEGSQDAQEWLVRAGFEPIGVELPDVGDPPMSDEGIDYAVVGVAGLRELCQEGDREACEELDRRGVEPELVELDEPDPISGDEWPKLTQEKADEIERELDELSHRLADVAEQITRFPGGGSPAHRLRVAVGDVVEAKRWVEEIQGVRA